MIAEAAALVKAYEIHTLTGDRYSGEFVTEQFRAHGLRYEASTRDRSTLYLELLPLVNAGRVVLLDVPDLLREFRGLERRRGASGRDRVDHRPGQHDDLANAVAGALVLTAHVPTHRIFYIERSGPTLPQLAASYQAQVEAWTGCRVRPEPATVTCGSCQALTPATGLCSARHLTTQAHLQACDLYSPISQEP